MAILGELIPLLALHDKDRKDSTPEARRSEGQNRDVHDLWAL